VLFKKFDIAHALEGDGKAKFGFGTYVTESYTSAACCLQHDHSNRK
jgi:hypothetical protein